MMCIEFGIKDKVTLAINNSPLTIVLTRTYTMTMLTDYKVCPFINKFSANIFVTLAMDSDKTPFHHDIGR